MAAECYGHCKPKEKELAEEQGDSLAPEVPFYGCQGGFLRRVHLVREFVQVKICICTLHDTDRILDDAYHFFFMCSFDLDVRVVGIERERLLLLDWLEYG